MTIHICPTCGKLVPQGHRCQPPAVPPISFREREPAERESPYVPVSEVDEEAAPEASLKAARREKKRAQTRLRVRRLRERRRLAAARQGGGE